MTASVRRSLVRLRNALRPANAEAELDREMTAHLTLLEDEYVRRGLTPAAARLQARRAFGGIDQAKERQRDARSFVWLDDLLRDARHGGRLLIRNPLFALTAALSIGIGIGANTAVFTVAYALLFRAPTAVAEPDRLVDLGTTRNQIGFGPSSYPNYLDIRQRTTTLDGLYALPLFPQPMSMRTAGGDAERAFVTPVTPNYFTTLGVVPALGRFFDTRDSDRPGASAITVVSDRFWMRRLNHDPAAIGRTITFNGRLFTIVGVAPPGFHGTGIRSGDAWIPLAVGGTVASNRDSAWLLVGGRLKPEVTLQQAQAEMDAIGRALQHEYPDENRQKGLRLAALSPVPGNTEVVAAFVLLLSVIVMIVLAIACANIVGVLLARAAARRLEIAVRLAIGAGRARLVRQLLTETLLLFLLGSVAGLALARAGATLVVSRLPQLPFPIELPLAIDTRAMLFTGGLALVAAGCSGLIPALQSAKAGVVAALKDDGHAPQRLRLRQVFVSAQIAFSTLLVAVALLFVRSLQLAGSADPGFDLHGLELASLDLSQAGYTAATGTPFTRTLLDRVRSRPDVESASLAQVLPGGFETFETGLQVPGVMPPDGEQGFGVDANAVAPGYFSTLRVPMISGRDFTDGDREGAEDVAIVGEGLARQFWPGQDPVGKYVVQPTYGPRGAAAPFRSLRIIGVVGDVKASSLVDGLAQPLLYLPLAQHFAARISIVARVRSGRRIADDLHAAVAQMNPDLPVTTQTLEEYWSLGLMPQRVATSLAGGLGLIGLLLAAIGIYGVTAYNVTSRTREFGIRLALGAPRVHVIQRVVRQGVLLIVVGAAAGLLLAAAAGRVLTAFLFGAAPIDPVMFSAAAMLFVTVGLAACLVPALRASAINPLEALRSE